MLFHTLSCYFRPFNTYIRKKPMKIILNNNFWYYRRRWSENMNVYFNETSIKYDTEYKKKTQRNITKLYVFQNGTSCRASLQPGFHFVFCIVIILTAGPNFKRFIAEKIRLMCPPRRQRQRTAVRTVTTIEFHFNNHKTSSIVTLADNNDQQCTDITWPDCNDNKNRRSNLLNKYCVTVIQLNLHWTTVILVEGGFCTNAVFCMNKILYKLLLHLVFFSTL